MIGISVIVRSLISLAERKRWMVMLAAYEAGWEDNSCAQTIHLSRLQGADGKPLWRPSPCANLSAIPRQLNSGSGSPTWPPYPPRQAPPARPAQAPPEQAFRMGSGTTRGRDLRFAECLCCKHGILTKGIYITKRIRFVVDT